MIKRIIFCIIILSSMASVSFAGHSEEATKLLYEAWGKYGEERISILKEIIDKYPELPAAERAQIDIADEYNSLGNLDKATQGYRKYVERYPRAEKAEGAQSWITGYLFDKGKYTEALTEYRKFLELFPDSPTKVFAECRIADIEYGKLKIITPQEAVKKYLQIYEKAGSKYHCSDVHWIVASIFENDLNNYQEAVFYYKKFLNEYPNTEKAPDVLWRITECSRKSGDSIQELNGYENIAKIYPGTRFAGDALMRIVFYGEHFEKKNEYAEALKAYLKFTELYPSQGWHIKGRGGYVGYGYDREIMRRIANIYQFRRDFDKAVSIYRRILADSEEFLQDGFTHFDKNIKYQLNHADIYRQLEFIYTQTGQPEGAKKADKKAKEIETDISDIKKAITLKFINKDGPLLDLSFDRIDIKNSQAIAEIGLSAGSGLGSGYKIWLERNKQGWIIKRFERTWVA